MHTADVAKITEGGPVLFHSVGMVIKFVRKNELPNKVYMLDDVVESKKDFPILRDDLRKDMYTFFNDCLTNYVNRKLVAGLCDVAVIDGKIHQIAVSIDDYAEDRAELVNGLAAEDNRIKDIVDMAVFYYKDDMGDIMSHVENGYDIPDDVVALVFASNLQYVKLDNLKLPTSKMMRNGDTMLLIDPSHSLPDSKLTPNTLDNEAIVITDDGSFMVGKSFKGRLTIRKLRCDEYFDYRKHAYKTELD